MSTLVVTDLRVEIGGRPVVDGVSFRVGPGDRTGLIGSSGSGKSMTALALLGLLPDGATATGSVVFDGTELLGADDETLAAFRGERLAMVFQDPASSLDPLMRVGRQITETLRVRRGVPRAESDALAVEWCRRTGLPDPAVTALAYPHQLSGGQRQRVAIAAALVAGPSLLIADEPTTSLDVTVQAEVLDLLDGLVSDGESSLLFITHDLALAWRMTNRLVVMDAGRIVESGPTREVVTAPRADPTKTLLVAARATSFHDDTESAEDPWTR